ncbi:MAG TPA: heterocyst frequency control protein PatD [Coleofasciculaceae cyanobacterium]|jgi:septum formation inhibitor MinC
MLPEPYRQLYQNFQRLLYQLQTQLAQGDRSLLQADLAAAQSYFQSQILAINLEELEPEGLEAAVAAKTQSFQVEINKQMRLLKTDLMFLQTARLTITQSQRQQQMGDRIVLLLRYCEAVLGET